MARSELPKTVAPGPNPTAGTVVTFTDADNSNGNFFVFTAQEMVIARNTHATDAKTVTITSAANSNGRTGDITALSVAAGAYKIFGPFKKREGWAQADGTFYLTAEGADIEFAVIQLPAN